MVRFLEIAEFELLKVGDLVDRVEQGVVYYGV